MIAVGTPCKSNGQVDNKYIEEVALELGSYLKPARKYLIVIKSTVPIGTNRRVSYIIKRKLEERDISNEMNVTIASNPEFLREGRAIYDMLYPDRIVIGVDDIESAGYLELLYKDILEQSFSAPYFAPRSEGYKSPLMIVTDPVSAELIKYAANSFLAIKISFINEIAGFCELIGANINDIVRGIGSDRRIGYEFLEPGIGWGGSCLPKDTLALISMGKEVSYPMKLVEVAREINYDQRKNIVDKLQKRLKGVRGKVIGILGLAFKPGTDDIRESPSLDIIKLLIEREAQVRVHDPLALKNLSEDIVSLGIEVYQDLYDLSVGADAIILATKWPEYKNLDFAQIFNNMRTKVVLDGRNYWSPQEIKRIGFDYIGIGI